MPEFRARNRLARRLMREGKATAISWPCLGPVVAFGFSEVRGGNKASQPYTSAPSSPLPTRFGPSQLELHHGLGIQAIRRIT